MVRDQCRILVIGAGVNGSLCASGLYRAGFDVTLLAREKRCKEILDQGIVIEEPFKKTRCVTWVPVLSTLEPDDRYEYILVLVRKNQVPELFPSLAGNCSPNLVFMINNPSGPEAFVQAVGRERVMLGFVFGAGRRDGSVIRAIGGAGSRFSPPFGELDGQVSPRLLSLVAIFRQAGFRADISRDISNYLATHAALVAPVARLLIEHGCDNYALARSTDDLRLLVEAMRETLQVLQADGFRIVPGNTRLVRLVPKFLLVAGMQRLFSTRAAEVGAAWHCIQAPDEMDQLGSELMVLVDRSGLTAPALHWVFQPVHDRDAERPG
jgi:2-dehydropantoate 2-reductase